MCQALQAESDVQVEVDALSEFGASSDLSYAEIGAFSWRFSIATLPSHIRERQILTLEFKENLSEVEERLTHIPNSSLFFLYSFYYY
jgi:hypothetical protein